MSNKYNKNIEETDYFKIPYNIIADNLQKRCILSFMHSKTIKEQLEILCPHRIYPTIRKMLEIPKEYKTDEKIFSYFCGKAFVEYFIFLEKQQWNESEFKYTSEQIEQAKLKLQQVKNETNRALLLRKELEKETIMKYEKEKAEKEYNKIRGV